MKFELPENHGLSSSIIDSLVFKTKDQKAPALSDVQHASLEVGIGRGASALIVSPTSTGKTQIALWAIAKSIAEARNVVYLVTHRALAKQKFKDFKAQLLPTFLEGNSSALVVATGDYIEDAAGELPNEPLGSPLLVATYEKYLAMISASGVPTDMSKTTIICDEIQLIGDKSRGQNVEVLLTLLKKAGWKQFVGLSAVLQPKDAADLAAWLGVNLVVQHTREKHLKYECWTPKGIASCNTNNPEHIDEGGKLPDGVELDTLAILGHILKQKTSVPIIVFCMRKADTSGLARVFLEKFIKPKAGQLSLAFDGLPETKANTDLREMIEHRVAFHNADLMDEERDVVEQYLLEGRLDIVFATTTLAAGVNFPLGAAIFAEWRRWNKETGNREPIDQGEFHNMAGRVGRMGFEHAEGRIIYIANDEIAVKRSRQYLLLGELSPLEPRITSERFRQLCLQLVASGLCHSRSEIIELVCSTFSGVRLSDTNNKRYQTWPAALNEAVDSLAEEVLVLETKTKRLTATPVGREIGYSGLQPETGIMLLSYLMDKLDSLVGCLSYEPRKAGFDRLNFLLFAACFSSPEFRGTSNAGPTRPLPWPIADTDQTIFDANPYKNDLFDPTWYADLPPINGAKITSDWISGMGLGVLETSLPQLSAGMLRDMFRNLAWVMQGLSAIIGVAADIRTPIEVRPKVLQVDEGKLRDLAKLSRYVRRLSFRVSEGLPDDIVWMNGLNSPGSPFRIGRHEMLALQSESFSTPEKLMLGTAEADKIRVKVFEKTKPSAQEKANWLRDATRGWKSEQRKRAADKHRKRAKNCKKSELVDGYYAATGIDFEKVFESILDVLGIQFKKLDDKTKTGAPDYLISLKDSPSIIFELKTKGGDKLVDYNRAVEVLAASEIHGYKDAFCVTLCHPGVDPAVPVVVADCARLCVVESNDLGECLLRICEGSLDQKQAWQWLTRPGQALSSDLPYKEYVMDR